MGERTDRRTGSPFLVGLSAADSLPPDGLEPRALRGNWGGGDSIAAAAEFHLRRGASTITSSDDPDTGGWTSFAMTRGTADEFRALCQHMRVGR